MSFKRRWADAGAPPSPGVCVYNTGANQAPWEAYLKPWFFILLPVLLPAQVEPAQRIVSLSPSLTEIVCEIGLCDRLVGVTEYCQYPAAAKGIAKVGGYINPNLEVVVAMRPDLVLALPEHQDTIGKLEKLGLRVETIRNWSIGDIWQSIETIGRVTSSQVAAQELLNRIKTVHEKATRIRNPKPKVLLALGHGASEERIKEVYLVGNNGFLNEMIGLSGGVNIYTKEKPYFPKLSQEALLQLNPDVVIELVPQDQMHDEEIDKKKRAWQSLSHLKAIKRGQYHIIHNGAVLQAGPRYLKTLTALNDILDNL